MSLILRDPIMRELLLRDYDRERALHPYWSVRQPVRVQRLGWPVTSSFDHALNELQSVMDTVHDAIGEYQGSLLKDLDAGQMRTTRTENGNLQVAMDVSQYKPEEINVKICDDNLVVEAKTESSENDSYHKSEFKRWIKLPSQAKQDGIKSTLTPDRKLLVEVPMNQPIEDKRSRSIPIDVQKEAVEDKKGNDQNTQNPPKK